MVKVPGSVWPGPPVHTTQERDWEGVKEVINSQETTATFSKPGVECTCVSRRKSMYLREKSGISCQNLLHHHFLCLSSGVLTCVTARSLQQVVGSLVTGTRLEQPLPWIIYTHRCQYSPVIIAMYTKIRWMTPKWVLLGETEGHPRS